MAGRVLIVDDDDFVAQAATALQAEGNTATTSSAIVDALDKLDAMPDVLITRTRFGPRRSNGLALARMARHRCPRIKIIFAALREFEQAAATAALGVFLAAPVSIPDLMSAVN